MKSTIQQDLRKTERRESQLWTLALGMLILFGGVIVAHHAIVSLGEAGSVPGIFLIPLFCLYVLYTLVRNGTVKELLVELNRMAASSEGLDSFLPNVARKIARAGSVPTCQIALLRTSPTLTIQSAHADAGVRWQPQTGKAFSLENLPMARRAIETLRPAPAIYY